MTKLEKLYSIIENSREVGVKLSKDVLQQVEELEEGIIKEEICDGWYIYSNISNSTKADDLKRISDHYRLGLKIEEGKPE